MDSDSRQSDEEVIERVSSDDIPALVRRVLALDEQLKAGPDSEARRDTWNLLTIELTASAVLIARAYSASQERITELERERDASDAALLSSICKEPPCMYGSNERVYIMSLIEARSRRSAT